MSFLIKQNDTKDFDIKYRRWLIGLTADQPLFYNKVSCFVFLAIDYLVGWLFEFHGTSTTMGHSMPNPVYIYELYMICNHFLYELTFSS